MFFFELSLTPLLISDLIFLSSHGGIFGSLSYGALMMAASAVGQWFWEKKYRSIGIFGIILLVSGLGLQFFIPISKHRVSISYIVLSGGVCTLFFLVLWFIYERYKITGGRCPILQLLGKNALACYILHGLLFLVSVFWLPRSIEWGWVVLVGL
ncbi:MAG: hypothetical protein ACTSRK_17105 [Promethearchaeota archaeon]